MERREDRNMKAFALSLAIALAFLTFFDWGLAGWMRRGAMLALCASLAWCGLQRRSDAPTSLLYWTLWGVLIVGVVAPLFSSGASPAAALVLAAKRGALWPQALVALLCSRAFAAEAALDFATSWDHPLFASSTLRLQSLGGALSLGAFFGICGALLLGDIHLDASDRAVATIAAALVGATPIHVAILSLFFFLMGIAAESMWMCVKDRAALARIRTALAARASSGDSASLAQCAEALSADARHYGQSATVQVLRGEFDPRAGRSADAYLHFRNATRRFARNLLPVLPLLGFLGTVVGLAISMSELQKGIDAGGAGAANISGALMGLAIKFETTILGLLANIVGLVLLNLCEKCESDLLAECGWFADSVLAHREGRDAATS
jgi:biopolymer transport protein ExbB/TolQ